MRLLKLYTLASVLILSGCTSAPSINYIHYTLTPAAAFQPMPAPRPYPGILVVQRIVAPAWLNSRDIYYQLAYHNEQTLSAYSRARWLAAPSNIMHDLLQDQLAGLGAWRTVVGPESELRADLSLQLRISVFHQRFDTPSRSYGLLRATATLIDSRAHRVLSQRTFQYREKAPTPDAPGAVAALNNADHQLLQDVAEWLVQTMRQDQGSLLRSGSPSEPGSARSLQ